MPTITLQHREGDDAGADSDRRFFKRLKDRRFRIRRAYSNEAFMVGDTPTDMVGAVITVKVSRHSRRRYPLRLSEGISDDLENMPEELIERLFKNLQDTQELRAGMPSGWLIRPATDWIS